MKKLLLVTLLVIVLLLTGTPYNGLNRGIAWEWGGVEITPDLSIFICGYDTPNFLAPIFPSLVTDC